MTESQSLPRERRLARRADFLKAYEAGRKLFSRYTVLFVYGNNLSYSRLGITATRKLGKANIRNRTKRWTREIYRRQRPLLDLDRAASDFVVNIKPNAVDASFQEFQEDFVKVLRRAAGEAGS